MQQLTNPVKTFFQCLILFSLSFTACKKANIPPVKSEPKPEDKTFTYTANVYASGYTTDSLTGSRQAVYWKNGVAVLLTQNEKEANGNAIAVQGNDVYVSGYITDANNKSMACYWKNGVLTKLAGPSSSAGSILINGADVYITGSVGGDAVYWKNGNMVRLSFFPYNTIAGTAGIGIKGTDIYVSGYQVGATSGATLWKNGNPSLLPGTYSYGGNLVVANGDVYIAATYGQPSASNTMVNYWKNGTPVILPNKTEAINAIDLAVEGNNVYVASNTEKGPAYFKNDVLNIIPAKYASISSLAVLNNDVYVAGYSDYQKKSVATFWRNGQPVLMFSPIGKSGNVSSIVVRPL